MTASTDIAIADYRNQHSEALSSRAHPEHNARVEGLSTLFEAKFAPDGSAVIPASDVSLTDFRTKYSHALEDRGHPDHQVRVDQLTKLTNDAVGGNEPGDSLMTPVASPDEFDLSRLKATAAAPAGQSLVLAPEVESDTRKWMAEGGLSKAEGEAMASIYGQSLTWSEGDVSRIAQATENGLRQKYGDHAAAAASAALRVAEEIGALGFLEQSGLINHWQVVNTLISRAEAKGYWLWRR
jgi:hypothetical protein